MGINLQKGQKVDLTKSNAGLSQIVVGLGWDPVKKGGLFGGIFSSQPQIDIDASVLVLDEQERLIFVVYYGELQTPDGSIVHTGDNRTGQGEGDDEQVKLNLAAIPAQVNKLIFVVNIYDCVKRKQDFGLIQNAFIRIFNPADGKELLRFNLSESYAGKTALVAGAVYRHQGEWKFAAIGEGTTDASLGEMAKKYQKGQ